jgi:predicted RNA binding protein YcfA (HicA-like mRNA interferase family)
MLCRDYGLTRERISGSHRVYCTPDGQRRLVVSVHPGRELHRGEVQAIRRDLEALQRHEEAS